MDAPHNSPLDQLANLRTGLDELVSIMDLPGSSTDGEPARIVTALLGLLGTLQLAFVFVRLNDRDDGHSVETVRVAEFLQGAVRVPRDIGRAIDSWLRADAKSSSHAAMSVGDVDLSVASAWLGVNGELGIVVAGSQRSDFPAHTESMLLDAAASQATIRLQRIELARHASELATATATLQNEAAERERAQKALLHGESESRSIMNTIPAGIALMAPDGSVELVNQPMLEYFGKEFEELKGWVTGNAVHPEDHPRVVERFMHSVTTGEPYDNEQRQLRHDGTYRWFQVRGVPLRDADGRITRWCVLHTDIDDRKRAEEALRESERASRLIVDSIPGLVALLSATGDVEVVNRQVLEYFGQTLEELRQWGTTDTVHLDDLPHVIEVFTRSIASGNPYEIVQRFKRFDGAYRWFLNSGFPVRDSNGAIVRWCVLLTDIDERKRAEDAVRASERNLQLIIDTIPAMAWSARPDGSAEFFNQHYLDFIGLSAEQASGWGWITAVHPEDLNGLAATWQRIMASEAPGEAEARVRRLDGQYRWFLFRANPLRDEAGTIVKWYGVNTDIEDRKQAEAELRRAYNSFRDAQRLSKTGSFITDLVGDDHNWSEEAYRIFEFDPASKVTVQRVRDVIHPDDLSAFESVIARGMTGVDVTFAFRIVTGGGAVKHVRGVAHVVERIAGRPMFVGALQDVTESKVAEDALNNARSELAHVSRVTVMSALTASIAHEVNQPLSGIITNAGTCLRMLDADPPNVDGARETARRTIRDGNRASDVIVRLRALFSRKEFTLESVDLNETTREVIALSLSDLQRHRIVLQVEFADNLPVISGDHVQLQQVILNLLRNAADAMIDVHDRPRQLLIRTEREQGDRVRLMVRDAGVGLNPQITHKLFDTFYTTKNDGMGIGLSVSRSIVERHDGRLWAEPNDGPGATFSFSIPVTPDTVVDPTPAIGRS
jgi:PAS domain S-box-containing protein